MDEEKKDELAPQEEPPKPPYIPASRGKRIAAWIGVVAMVLLVLLYTYSIATGSFLLW